MSPQGFSCYASSYRQESDDEVERSEPYDSLFKTAAGIVRWEAQPFDLNNRRLRTQLVVPFACDHVHACGNHLPPDNCKVQIKMTPEPSEKNVNRMWAFAKKYAEKTGTSFSPIEGVTEAVINGLAVHQDTLGRPLCPCRFYQDKQAEIQSRTWICACEDMKNYKYCHCLLFTNPDGLPITEYLPEDHEGREAWGLVTDPTPDKGREGSK